MKKLLLLVCLAAPAFAFAQNTSVTAPEHTISVVGIAEMEIVPDEIYVGVYIQEFTKEKKKYTIEELETALLNFVEKSTSTPRSDVKMDNTSANVIAMKRKQKDAVISKSYEIKYKNNEQVALLFASADSLNLQSIFVVRYSHSKMDEYKQQVRINAMKDARTKADYLMGAVGQKAGKATTVNETSPEVGVYDGIPEFRPFRGNTFYRSNGDNMGTAGYLSNSVDNDEQVRLNKTIKLVYRISVDFEIM